MEKFIVKQNKALRDSNYIRIIYNKIQLYIKNGCVGDLYLCFSPINKLPSNLKRIGGDLIISYTNLDELPNNMVIEGDLWCRYTNIEKLPDDIEIKGSLFCFGTPLNLKYFKRGIKSKWKIYDRIYYKAK